MVQVFADATSFKELTKKYPTSVGEIEKLIENKCEYYSKMNDETLEKFGFEMGKKEEWIEKIKDFIVLIQENYEEKKKELIIQKKEESQIMAETRSEFLELISGKDKKWSEATELLVDYVLDRNYIYTTKDDVKSEMWIYKEGIYVPQGRSEIKILLRQLLGNWYSQYIYGLVIAKIEPDTSIESTEFFNNNFIDEVPLMNGILNLKTRELNDFDPKKIFFSKLPIKYNPENECGQIDDFLETIFSNEEDKKVFYELGGFCLLNEYTYEKAFMFVGAGRNGKDKSIELLKRTLGVENCSAVPIGSLKADSFIISELFGKKANLAGEISNQDLKDTSSFKALTGRSLISAKRKFLTNISFVNYAKFVFACNELPMVYDTSRGFWDRWVLLEFPYTFVSEEEYNESKDNSKLKIRDANIIDKITTEEELSGLLNKFLEGLDRLIENKKFSSTKGTEEIKNMWIRKSNSFIAFCMDNIEQNYEKKISKKELRRKYIKYCKEHKVSAKSDFVIKRFLQDEFGAMELQTSSIGNTIDRYWEGIAWKNT